MSDHSLISPSMLYRMFGCPGSVLASKDIPNTSSPAAERGTMIHGLAEEMLRVGFTDATDLSQEEHKNLRDYCAYVKNLVGNDAHLYVEEEVSLDGYVTDMRGTIDALIVGDDYMHVVDLKTGSVPVNAEHNSQLLAYALGAAAKYDAFEKKITLHIWQAGNVNSDEVLGIAELNEFAKKLMNSADIALSPEAPRNPSESSCRYCPAAPECPALYGHQLAVVGGSFVDLTAPEKLTDDQIAMVVLNKPKIEKYLKQVNSYALERSRMNNPVAGTKVVEGRAVRRFTKSGREALVELLGDTAYEKKLIGVTAADALVGKDMVDAMTKKVGTPTVVGLDDSRPAITNAVDDFDCI